MKRFIAFSIIICLLLCGCQTPAPTPAPTPDPAPTGPADTPPTPPTDTEPTTPPQPDADPVTVYLLEETVLFDSGYTKYSYDENYNIDSYTVYTIEKEPMYTAYFEEKDANGMPCKYRAQWPDDGGGETRTLSYFADGKLNEEQMVGGNFSGYQYEYDLKGDITEKREYYDGILESTVYFEYDGETLRAVYGEDPDENRLFDCRIENGLITEKICYENDSSYSYIYKYDENKNLVETRFIYEGEDMPAEQFYYKAVEVDPYRAMYLLEQQKYLQPVV